MSLINALASHLLPISIFVFNIVALWWLAKFFINAVGFVLAVISGFMKEYEKDKGDK